MQEVKIGLFSKIRLRMLKFEKNVEIHREEYYLKGTVFLKLLIVSKSK